MEMMNFDNLVASQGEDHLDAYKSKLMVQDTQLKIVELKLESSSLNASHMKTLNQQLQWNLEQVDVERTSWHKVACWGMH